MAIDIGKIRNVGVVGHGGVGKTSLVESMLFAAGATNRLGKVDDGTTDHRLRSRRDQAQDLAQHRGGLLRLQGSSPQPDRHPRIRRLRRRRARRSAGGRSAAVVVVDAVAGRAGADREGLEVRQRVRSAARHRRQPPRPRAGRLLPHARVAAEAPQGPARAAPGADRRARAGFRGVRRSGHHEGLDHRRRQGQGGRHSRRRDGRRVKAWREKLVEAAAETDDDLLAKYLEEGSIGEAEMLEALRQGIAQGRHRARARAPRRPGASASTPLLDLIVKEFPSPADRGAVEGTDLETKQAGDARARSQGAAHRARLQDDRPIPTSASCRSSACTRARFGPTARCSTPTRGGRGAHRAMSAGSGQDPEAGGGAGAGRDRRGGQAQGHPHRRHALRRGAAR